MVKEIEGILDEFDFHKVQIVMKALDWKYYDSLECPPSIGEIRRTARRLLQNAYDAKPSQNYVTGSGGLVVTRDMYPGDIKKYLELSFVVESWSNYEYD